MQHKLMGLTIKSTCRPDPLLIKTQSHFIHHPPKITTNGQVHTMRHLEFISFNGVRYNTHLMPINMAYFGINQLYYFKYFQK